MKDFFLKLKKLLDAIDKYDIDYDDFEDFIGFACSDDNQKYDIEVGNYRFIHKDKIDKIIIDELKSEQYLPGCFNADFIADNTDLSIDIVQALQKSESFDDIGNHIIDNDFLEDFVQAYVDADGYEHYFATYDGILIEDFLDFGYYCFRVN